MRCSWSTSWVFKKSELGARGGENHQRLDGHKITNQEEKVVCHSTRKESFTVAAGFRLRRSREVWGNCFPANRGRIAKKVESWENPIKVLT